MTVEHMDYKRLPCLHLAEGRRFACGKNWRKFLPRLNEERITGAERSLMCGLGVGRWRRQFSLAARRMGAQVLSVDFDTEAVGCAQELRQRHYPDESGWLIAQDSALDQSFLREVGTFDVVYSWGVLHHTGAMWEAAANVAQAVAPGGSVLTSISNDQGKRSMRWLAIKKLYNRCPRALRFLILCPVIVRLGGRYWLRDLLKWRHDAKIRGMSPWYDVVDWVGGYPCEVATPEAFSLPTAVPSSI